MVGLEKLAFAESQVGQMQVELKELQPQLVVAAEENEKMMKVSGKLAKIFWFKRISLVILRNVAKQTFRHHNTNHLRD